MDQLSSTHPRRALVSALIVEDEVVIALDLQDDMSGLGFEISDLATNPNRAFSDPKHGTFPTAIGFFPAILASFLRNARRGSMTDQPGVTKDGVCRRSLLKSAPMIVGAIISATAIPDTLFAQTKLSHEASKYQDQPKDGQQCSTCVQFEPPSACKTVESPISPNGWCQLYVAKPA